MQRNKDTAKQIQQIVSLLCEGCTHKEIAAAMGISAAWLSEIKRRNPVIRQEYERYKAQEIKHPFRCGVQAEVLAVWARHKRHPAAPALAQLINDYKLHSKKY